MQHNITTCDICGIELGRMDTGADWNHVIIESLWDWNAMRFHEEGFPRNTGHAIRSPEYLDVCPKCSLAFRTKREIEAIQEKKKEEK